MALTGARSGRHAGPAGQPVVSAHRPGLIDGFFASTRLDLTPSGNPQN